MKILHCCLSCFYIDGFGYQENILPIINNNDGHIVKIIASRETFIDGKVGYIKANKYIINKKIEVIRLNYKNILTNRISSKVRSYKRCYKEIEKFKPDVILFHGMCAYELLTVSKYKKNNPNIKLYVDSHEDFTNSAKTFFSKNILHRLFYKKIALKCLKYIDKVLYISEETRIFLQDFYEIPNKKLEFYPLGGFIIEREEKQEIRKKIRKDLKINQGALVLIHSGKLDRLKKTKELLEVFSTIKSNNLYLIIIGSIPDEEKLILNNLIKSDKRIIYLGWKSSNDLIEYICASDIYMQPGSQSSTALTAVCCGLPILLYPSVSYLHLFDTNVFWARDKKEIKENLEKVIEDREFLKNMESRSYEIAKNILDYQKLARRLYE
ncbi:hypothetical protein FUSO5_09665 [Fusobacterium necrophorum BFTR-1]|uniref:glycosyltransferase family 4 protein n=1 Tax=Fusobacterium necrophorum TaxID=859 RepID=UPI0004616DA0|nr:glycosyltransferase family 4 protein [Fusobacterium necrophorum]KDE62462.1 hypothetical protein FUSO5_09665 [Fusobacterium necrophorum BFTR-1]MCF0161648.1 glycosyltransferase family 4 protein [Fusobacterium necrophorum]